MYTHSLKILQAGNGSGNASQAYIFVHGRGGTAEDILGLHTLLAPDDALLLAPQANHNSWYPYSFMKPESENQPAIDSGVQVLEMTLKKAQELGVPPEKTFWIGFSQGACLTLEFAARNAQKLGGIVAFTGGLIGDTIDSKRYDGDFGQTPVLITTGNPDPHVPVLRVEETAAIYQKMNAAVETEIFENKPHIITSFEIDLAARMLAWANLSS